jgi:type IV pilus assembly protein PilQ
VKNPLVSLFVLAPFFAFARPAAAQAPEVSVSLDVQDRDLREVVEFLRQQTGVNLVLDPDIEETVTLSLVNVPWRQALELAAERAGCVVVGLAPNLFKIEKPPRVHFAFEDTDLTKVIDAIGKISGANIVVAPEVKGTVTIRLKDIPWRDALEAAVKTLGFVVVEEDRGILRVVDPATLQAQLDTRSFQLRYLRPPSTYTPKIDSPYVVSPFSGTGAQATGGVGGLAAGREPAAERVKREFSLLQALEKALSPQGRLDYIDRQNVLIVRDTKTVLDRIQRVIDELDIEPQQVFVDVKFVATSNTDLFDFGVNFGDQGATISATGGQVPIELPFRIGDGGFEDSILAAPGPFGPFANDVDADGNANSAENTIVPPTIFGALSFTEVTAALRLLKQDDKSELVQAPKIIAIDHQPATIFVGDEVRWAQARAEQGQAGGAFLSVEEAPDSPIKVGFQLLIIPHVVSGTDKIIMDVIPKQDALTGTGGPPLAPPGFDVFIVGTGAGAGGSGTIALPRVSSSTIATTLILESGQSAGIGGLTTHRDQETVTKIPFLGDIPILGWVFKNKQATRDRRSLLVLITPSLVRSPEETSDILRKELERRQEWIRSEYERILEGTPREAPGPSAASADGTRPSAGTP